MKRYDMIACNFATGLHVERQESRDGEHCDAEEAMAEIARLRGLLLALVAEIDEPSFRAPLYRPDCPQCEENPVPPEIVCPYHAAKAALEEA